jgi:hypothetical protein
LPKPLILSWYGCFCLNAGIKDPDIFLTGQYFDKVKWLNTSSGIVNLTRVWQTGLDETANILLPQLSVSIFPEG